MKKFITLLLVVCFTNSYATIWFVSEGGKGTKDGTSWSNAAADFPDLLQDPTVNPSQKWDTQGPIHPNPGDTIFVRYGTYSPIVLWHGETFDTTTNMYYQSHQNLIHIYGGFRGKETSLEERTNWKHYESIIEYYDNTKNFVYYRNNIIEYSFYNFYWNLLGQDLGWNNDDDPMFIDSNNFDYRIQNFSPAYDKGNFDKYDTLIFRSGLNYQHCHLLNYDINCNNRIFDKTIDIGACEYYENTNYISSNYLTLPSEFNQEGTSNLNIDNIKIFDMTGSILKYYNSNEEINFSNLQKGVYVIGYFYKNTLVKSNKIVLTK